MFLRRIFLSGLFLSLFMPTHAQVFDRLLDIFDIPVNLKAVSRDSTIYPSSLVMAPIVSYAPETNWGFGVGAKYLFKFKGAGQETRTSNMPMSLIYTLNHQILLMSGFTIFFNQERYLLKGNIRYNKLPLFYYGVGNNTPEKNEELYDFSNILIEPVLLRKVKGNWFAGGGIRYNIVHHVHFPKDGLLARERFPGYMGSTSAGLELALTYDSRDNVLYAKKGTLLEIGHGFYYPILGGEYDYRIIRVDFRKYYKVFDHRNDIFAFQVLGYFANGNVPLSDLARLGGHELMRGYYEGRFRDRSMIAFQAEYRLQLIDRLGAVIFAGVGDVSPRLSSFRVKDAKPSLGAGLRFMIVKEENLNIRFDYGFGKQTRNYYFNIAEAF